MPLMYELSKHATFIPYPGSEEDLTEQEHKDSCDINHMMRSLDRGIEVRGNNNIQFGYDDTTMSGLELRIHKQNLERDLAATAETHEFDEEELKNVHPDVQKKFGFKTKKAPKPDAKRDEPNDAKKVGKEPSKEPDPKTTGE